MNDEASNEEMVDANGTDATEAANPPPPQSQDVRAPYKSLFCCVVLASCGSSISFGNCLMNADLIGARNNADDRTKARRCCYPGSLPCSGLFPSLGRRCTNYDTAWDAFAQSSSSAAG